MPDCAQKDTLVSQKWKLRYSKRGSDVYHTVKCSKLIHQNFAHDLQSATKLPRTKLNVKAPCLWGGYYFNKLKLKYVINVHVNIVKAHLYCLNIYTAGTFSFHCMF